MPRVDVTCTCGKTIGSAFWREVHEAQKDARIKAERERLTVLCETCRKTAAKAADKARAT